MEAQKEEIDYFKIGEKSMRSLTRSVVKMYIPIIGSKFKIWEHRRDHNDDIALLVEWNEDSTYKVLDVMDRGEDYRIAMKMAEEHLKSLGYHRYVKVVDTLGEENGPYDVIIATNLLTKKIQVKDAKEVLEEIYKYFPNIDWSITRLVKHFRNKTTEVNFESLVIDSNCTIAGYIGLG